MKKIQLVASFHLLMCGLSILCAAVPIRVAAADAPSPSSSTPDPRQDRLKAWHAARFGMFMHWGLYAIPADGEWYMNNHSVPAADYEKFAAQFNPVKFDADQWCRSPTIRVSGISSSPRGTTTASACSRRRPIHTTLSTPRRGSEIRLLSSARHARSTDCCSAVTSPSPTGIRHINPSPKPIRPTRSITPRTSTARSRKPPTSTTSRLNSKT